MDIFSVGIIVLFIIAAIFFIALFSFIYYWHLTKVTYIVVPAIFTFEFLAAGFFTVAVISIVLNYLPQVIRALGI